MNAGTILRHSAVTLGLAAALTGCASLTPTAPPAPPAAPPVATTPDPGVQTGRASWYGAFHQGRLTASGEAYDMNQLTAAHPTLPLGTRLQVTNLKNGRSVEVRVNDRGPVVDGRIIDLSYAAAARIGAVSDGVVPVRVRVLTP
jgi:rare lipoprotein A